MREAVVVLGAAARRARAARCTRVRLLAAARLAQGAHGVADDLADALARVQRRVAGPGRPSASRAAADAARAGPACVMSRPPKRTAPPVGSSSRRSAPAERGLAAARLADQPERLALPRWSASRRRPRARAPTSRSNSTPSLIGKCVLEVLDRDERLLVDAHDAASVSAATARSRPSTSRRGALGLDVEPAAIEVGRLRPRLQRRHAPCSGRTRAGSAGRKGQPSGAVDQRRRRRPGSTAADRRCGRSRRGIEPSSPHV